MRHWFGEQSFQERQAHLQSHQDSDFFRNSSKIAAKEGDQGKPESLEGSGSWEREMGSGEEKRREKELNPETI